MSGEAYNFKRLLRLYGQEKKAHKVDALAVRGDEGRGILRKASGS